MSYPEQVYEAAKRTVVAYGWPAVPEVESCEIWAGSPLMAVMHALSGGFAAGISNVKTKQIAICSKLPDDSHKARTLLHEMAHLKLEHGERKAGERFGTVETERENQFEREADTVAKLACHKLGLEFPMDRGNTFAHPDSRLVEVADELARDVYSQIRERAA